MDAGSLANRQQAVQDVSDITGAARQTTAAPAQAQTQQTTEGETATTPAPANQYGQLGQDQVSRFQEVINAKYQGPESLRQAGLYELASDKVNKAQNTINQSKTATGREEMLRNLFAQRGDYTQGLNKLDAGLLNASKEGVSALNQAAQAQGNIGQQLDQAQINSANAAQNRASEIKDIQEQARQAFSTGKAAEEAATEERLS